MMSQRRLRFEPKRELAMLCEHDGEIAESAEQPEIRRCIEKAKARCTGGTILEATGYLSRRDGWVLWAWWNGRRLLRQFKFRGALSEVIVRQVPEMARQIKDAEAALRQHWHHQSQQDAEPKRIEPAGRQKLSEYELRCEGEDDQDGCRQRVTPGPTKGGADERVGRVEVHDAFLSRILFSSSISDGLSFSVSRKRARNGASSPSKKRPRNERVAACSHSAAVTSGRNRCSRP